MATKEPELLAKFGEFEHIADINLPNGIPMTPIVRLCPSRAIYSVCVHLLGSYILHLRIQVSVSQTTKLKPTKFTIHPFFSNPPIYF